MSATATSCRSRGSLKRAGYTPGSSVLVEDLGGRRAAHPAHGSGAGACAGIADRIVGEHPEAMEILANHDPDADDARP